MNNEGRSTTSNETLRPVRRMSLIKLAPLPSSTSFASESPIAFGTPEGVQVTEVIYCHSCKAPMKANWERCPGCKTPAPLDSSTMSVAVHQNKRTPEPNQPSKLISNTQESPQQGQHSGTKAGADTLLVPGSAEKLQQQRHSLGFSLTCANCNAPIKPAWPRCPSCRTPVPKCE